MKCYSHFLRRSFKIILFSGISLSAMNYTHPLWAGWEDEVNALEDLTSGKIRALSGISGKNQPTLDQQIIVGQVARRLEQKRLALGDDWDSIGLDEKLKRVKRVLIVGRLDLPFGSSTRASGVLPAATRRHDGFEKKENGLLVSDGIASVKAILPALDTPRDIANNKSFLSLLEEAKNRGIERYYNRDHLQRIVDEAKKIPEKGMIPYEETRDLKTRPASPASAPRALSLSLTSVDEQIAALKKGFGSLGLEEKKEQKLLLDKLKGAQDLGVKEYEDTADLSKRIAERKALLKKVVELEEGVKKMRERADMLAKRLEGL